MAKDFAIITLHGIGDTDPDYHKGLEEKLREEVGEDTWDTRVHLESVFYQNLMQRHQEKYWETVNKDYGLRWDVLRKFLLYGFSDAASIEHSLRSDQVLYKAVHQRIATAFDNAYVALGNEAKPVFLIVHSLGAQEVSNYIWDAKQGVRFFSEPGPGDARQRDFRKFGTCRQLITTGCNIPLFKAGLRDPKNFERPNEEFTWHNYFDVDDVLGYPIKPIAPSFEVDWIEDHKVGVGGFILGRTPASHTMYWTDKDVVEPIANDIKAILGV